MPQKIVFGESEIQPSKAGAIVFGADEIGAPVTSTPERTWGDTAKDNAIGLVQSGVGAFTGLGNLVHQIPGVTQAVDTLYGTPGVSEQAFAEAQQATTPQNSAQATGKAVGDIAQYFVPSSGAAKVATGITAKLAPLIGSGKVAQAAARIVPRMGTEAAASGAVAGVQGSDPTVAATMGAAVPLAGGAVTATAKKIGALAHPLVRAAIKPTVTAMRQVAGASVTGLDAQAERLVGFIVDNRLMNAGQARTMVTAAENDLTKLLANKNAVTDAPQRAIRYLEALERSARKQGLPAADVGTIRNAAAEVLQSGLGEDVITMVSKPHPTLLGPNGKPIMVLVPQTTRALRTDVMADEALERARANSKWDTKKAWGEQKGAQLEASKAVERAERDAVKAAVPEAKDILAKQGMAIQTAKVLDRAEFRQGNRDALSLPGTVMAAGEIASGKLPIMGMAVNWLRDNQLKAGIWADRLSKAIERNNVGEVAAILARFGVATTGQMIRPAPR